MSTSRFATRAAVLTITGVVLCGVRWVSSSDVRAAEPVADYIVVYQAPEHVDRDLLKAHGHKVKSDLGRAGVMVISTASVSDLRNLPGVAGVAIDQPAIGVPRDEIVTPMKGSSGTPMPKGCANTHRSCGYQWDLDRIHVPEAWKTTTGNPDVRVAVLDSGLRASHEELGPNYDIGHSFSAVQPNSDCAADDSTYSSIEDVSGHGTWTNTHVAGRNGSLMTGIAPDVSLINVRVLSRCGFAYHSWILNGMFEANVRGAQIENISLGGYVCADGVVSGSFYCGSASNDDPFIWQAYRQMVRYLREHGTLVIAAAGNEHVRLDKRGRVISAGSLAVMGPVNDPGNDLRGLSEVPGGVPGVISVAAVNRVTGAGTADETLYGQYGVHAKDQLTYYSSYGKRIDVSAPGGARFFNIPAFDCFDALCGALGPIKSKKLDDNPGDFGAWAFDDLGIPCDGCYVFIQGTSMATPQVSGVAALALSAHRGLTTEDLVDLLRTSVSSFSDDNATPAIATKRNSLQYNFDVDYSGKGIDNQLMGTGVIDAAKATARR